MLNRLLLAAALAGAAAVPTIAAGSQSVDVTTTLVLPSLSGEDTFRYYCASCHGRSGRGDGPVAPALKTKPANLTRLAATNGGQFPLERVRTMVARGRGDTLTHGTGEMPVWGPIFQVIEPSDKLAQARINNVVSYIQSIQTK
jgi:mono/diheme cytochrome c family protein